MNAFEVSPQRLRAHVQSLSYPRNRLDEAVAMDRAEAFVSDCLTGWGWSVSRQPYRVEGELLGLARNLTPAQQRRLPGCPGANLVAFRQGGKEGSPVFLLGAHLDTLSHTSGADDNTSGIAGLLELGFLLKDVPLHRSLALVAFDMEEWNLLGSRVFVQRLPWPVAGAVVFECLGYFSQQPHSQTLPPGLNLLYPKQWKQLKRREFRGEFALVVYRRRGAALAGKLSAALRATCGEAGALQLRDPADLPWLGGWLRRKFPFVDHFTRSDHAPFWFAGLPAVMLTDTAEFRNPHYHRASDLPEQLDFARMAEVIRGCLSWLAMEGVVGSSF